MGKTEVNVAQCRAVGGVLKTLVLKPKTFEREYITFEATPETKIRAYLASVAICHQTHTLIHKRMNLVGFNYLERVYVDLAKEDSEILDPFSVSQKLPERLSADLALRFTETGECTLDRLVERAELLIDMNRQLVDRYSGSLLKLLEQTNGYIDGEQGLYRRLSDFKAYSDPFRKKSSLFIDLLLKADLFAVKDLECLVPIMDYHIQRTLLRLGCVEIKDPQLRQALIDQKPLDSDEEIRAASIEAVKELAIHSGHPLGAIHDFFWPLGRSCCKENPLCKTGSCCKNPCTFEQFVHLSSHKKCEFEGVCKGSQRESYIKLWQPLVETHYY